MSGGQPEWTTLYIGALLLDAKYCVTDSPPRFHWRCQLLINVGVSAHLHIHYWDTYIPLLELLLAISTVLVRRYALNCFRSPGFLRPQIA